MDPENVVIETYAETVENNPGFDFSFGE